MSAWHSGFFLQFFMCLAVNFVKYIVLCVGLCYNCGVQTRLFVKVSVAESEAGYEEKVDRKESYQFDTGVLYGVHVAAA